MEYLKQVDKEIYDSAYESKERWASFAVQIIESLSFLKKNDSNNLLEVGVGSKTYLSVVKSKGVMVTTVDIDPELEPDYVASVTALPFPDKSFDMAVAFEVLEHIEFADVATAISELLRVSKHGIMISVPDVYPYLSVQIKLPLLKTFSRIITLPVALKKDRFDGEHYWEIGRRNHPLKKILAVIDAAPGAACKKHFRVPGCPFHHFFIIEKQK